MKATINLEALQAGLALLTLMAVIVQQITRQIARHVPKYTAHVAGLVGVLTAWLTGLGLLETLGLPVQIRNPWVDEILTGVLLAGGASIFTAIQRWMEGRAAAPAEDVTTTALKRRA